MYIKQISVFIENRKGRLDNFATLLEDNRVDLAGISVADTTNFGILRVIVDEPERTAGLLRQGGYTANITEVLAIAVPDEPGGLAQVLRLLSDNDVSIEYLYSLVSRAGEQAVIVCKVDEPEKAAKMFLSSGIRLLKQEEVSGGA